MVRVVRVLRLHVLEALAGVVSDQEIAKATQRPLDDYHPLRIDKLVGVGIMDGQGLQLMALRHELHFLSNSDDAATGLSLDVLLRYVLALIVEESIRVAGPCDAAHVDLRNDNRLTFKEALSVPIPLANLIHLSNSRRARGVLARGSGE